MRRAVAILGALLAVSLAVARNEAEIERLKRRVIDLKRRMA